MRTKSLTGIRDLSAEEIREILDLATVQKRILKSGGLLRSTLQGKAVGMMFEKPSLRTRVSFEIATTQLGGHVVFMGADEVQIGKRETVADFARVLSRYVDMIVTRTFKQEHVEEIALESSVPVINALSDYEHPCQALGDMLTISEHLGECEGLSVCFIGDGNNVARSLAVACAALGARFTLAAPEGYSFEKGFFDLVREYAPGADLLSGADPREMVSGADVVYTDVWASMGQEAETEKRKRDFKDFQLNSELMNLASKKAIAMHCLPAHRGEEITGDVMDSARSVVYDQAENRLHAQRALMTILA